MGKYKAEERNKFVYMYLNYVNTCKILVLKNFFNKKNIYLSGMGGCGHF